MNILMVLSSKFPPDSRVEKEAISLSENGHEVHIICYSDGINPELEVTKHFTIHRFKFSSFRKNKLSALALIYPMYFLLWIKQVKKIYTIFKFNAIHIHDLPLSKIGYFFKKIQL